jgi:hypothetical protein|tara:strand:+ start:65 stop:370 length:306 start_codon:yes stop_codon:yes gene_type:complete
MNYSLKINCISQQKPFRNSKKSCSEFWNNKKQVLDKRQKHNVKHTVKLLRTISKGDMDVIKELHDDIVHAFHDSSRDNDTVFVDTEYMTFDEEDEDDFFTN